MMQTQQKEYSQDNHQAVTEAGIKLVRKGFTVQFLILGQGHQRAACVTALKDNHTYKFSDPDWQVVIKQLNTLLSRFQTKFL